MSEEYHNPCNALGDGPTYRSTPRHKRNPIRGRTRRRYVRREVAMATEHTVGDWDCCYRANILNVLFPGSPELDFAICPKLMYRQLQKILCHLLYRVVGVVGSSLVHTAKDGLCHASTLASFLDLVYCTSPSLLIHAPVPTPRVKRHLSLPIRHISGYTTPRDGI